LIAPDEGLEKTKSGILLVSSTVKQERHAQATGTVLAIGKDCWLDSGDGSQWCEVGDRIVYSRNAGMKFWDPITGDLRDDLILLNDVDITAKITEEVEYE